MWLEDVEGLDPPSKYQRTCTPGHAYWFGLLKQWVQVSYWSNREAPWSCGTPVFGKWWSLSRRHANSWENISYLHCTCFLLVRTWVCPATTTSLWRSSPPQAMLLTGIFGLLVDAALWRFDCQTSLGAIQRRGGSGTGSWTAMSKGSQKLIHFMR